MGTGTFCILLVCAFSAMLGLGVISPFLPEFAAQHGVNGFWMAMIFSGFAVSRGLIMPLVGRLSDRKGRKIFVAGGLFLFSLVSLLYPLADSAFSMTAVRLIHGLAAGLIIPIVVSYAADFAEKGREGRTTGTLYMMFYLGLASGPFIGGYLNQTFGFDVVFYSMSGLGMLAFMITLIFLHDPQKNDISTAEILKGMPFTRLFSYNFIKGVLIMAVVMTLMTTVFMSFLPSLATLRRIDPDHIGIIISVGIFLAGILQVPFGRLADRFGRAGKLSQIGVGMSISMSGLFVMPLCPDFHALLLAGAVVGTGAAVSTSALMCISVGIGHRTGMGTWMGILNSATSLGIMISPLVFGVAMDHIGIDAVFYMSVMVTSFGGFLAFYYIRRRMAGKRMG